MLSIINLIEYSLLSNQLIIKQIIDKNRNKKLINYIF